MQHTTLLAQRVQESIRLAILLHLHDISSESSSASFSPAVQIRLCVLHGQALLSEGGALTEPDVDGGSAKVEGVVQQERVGRRKAPPSCGFDCVERYFA